MFFKPTHFKRDVADEKGIAVSSKDIVEKGDPKINLVEKFMQDECKKLFEFAKND